MSGYSDEEAELELETAGVIECSACGLHAPLETSTPYNLPTETRWTCADCIGAGVDPAHAS